MTMYTKGVQPKTQYKKKKRERICNLIFDEHFPNVTILFYSKIILNNTFSLTVFSKAQECLRKPAKYLS